MRNFRDGPQFGEVFKRFASQKESRIEEGHLMPDHVHVMIAIPPKYAVSQVVGYIKGKSAIHMARVYAERKRSFVGQHFWARGYFVSTVGRDEELIPGIYPQPGRGCAIGSVESVAMRPRGRLEAEKKLGRISAPAQPL